jgi:hypothetical protein
MRKPLDFSDPSRFDRMRALFAAEPQPDAFELRTWSDVALNLAAWLAMVAAAAYVGSALLGAW